MSDEISNLIGTFLTDSMSARLKYQSQMFKIFTETTGYCPQDLCLVEQRYGDKVVYYFDWKHRHQKVELT